MATGIKATNLPSSDTLDSVLAIKSAEGLESVVQTPVDKLAIQLAGSGALAAVHANLQGDIDRVESTANTSTYTVQTHTDLLAITPDAETNGGVVLNDPDPAKCGYYYRDGAAWVLGRGFAATMVELALTGSATEQVGTVVGSPNLTSTMIYFATVGTINTGVLTLSIVGLNGDAALPVKNIAGSDHSAGQWTGYIMLVDKVTHYQVINAPDGVGVPGQQGIQGETGGSGIQGEPGPLGITWRGGWGAGDYDVSDAVSEAGASYICLVDHTASDFATDFGAGKWGLIADKGQSGSGTGDMVGANNFSELTNIVTAKTKLDLQNVQNTPDAEKPISTAQTAVNTAQATTNTAHTDAIALKAATSGLAVKVAGQFAALSDEGALTGTEVVLLGSGKKTTAQAIGDLGGGSSGGGPNFNWVLNGDFNINQIGASAKAQSVGVYGYDMWKGHANGLEQTIEALPAGEYTLTWTGGGAGTLDGTTSASPIVATVATGNKTVVIPASATKISLVAGDASGGDPWAARHIAVEMDMCQRYYEQIPVLFRSAAWPTISNTVYCSVMKRTTSVVVTSIPDNDSGGVYAKYPDPVSGSMMFYQSVAHGGNNGGILIVDARF